MTTLPQVGIRRYATGRYALALGLGLAVVAVPGFLPSGPDSGIDAARFLDSGRFLVGALLVFAGGFLTALTPCVYPLIPITVSVFGARKAESRGKALLLTSAYVLGMGLVFATLGVVAARTGAAFGSLLGKPAFAFGLALVMVVLASSMFGAFELALPSSWAGKLTGVGGAGVAGAFLMGTVSGFLAAPCTGPVLAGLLAFVAKTQSTLLGGGLLFIYALGVGVPFFLIGAFALQLPKSGAWMESVKSVLGVMLLALGALYVKDAWAPAREAVSNAAAFIGRVPGAWLAGGVVALGIFAGAIHLSFKESRGQAALKGVAVAFVVAALVLRMGALNAPQGPGVAWVKLGLAHPPACNAVAWNMEFGQKITELARFDAVLARARAEGKPVMIDFFADWCAACKELDRETYVSKSVILEASRFVNIKVDATNAQDAIDHLYERFGIQGLPTVAFVGADGKILLAPRVTGFLTPDKFLLEQRKVLGGRADGVCVASKG